MSSAEGRGTGTNITIQSKDSSGVVGLMAVRTSSKTAADAAMEKTSELTQMAISTCDNITVTADGDKGVVGLAAVDHFEPDPKRSKLSNTDEDKQFEKKIGPLSVAEEVVQEGLQKACKVVCYIEDKGTGFLVGKDLVMTCNHVVPSREEAESKRFKFNFTKTSKEEERPKFRFKRDGLFVTNSDPDLDYTLVQLESQSIEKPAVNLTSVEPSDVIGSVTMSDAVKIRSHVNQDTGVCVIQHPDGSPRMVSLHGKVLAEPGGGSCFQHDVSTDYGSSGSPVFNQNFYLFGIHASFSKANEGIFIGSVLRDMKSKLDNSEIQDPENEATLQEFLSSAGY